MPQKVQKDFLKGASRSHIFSEQHEAIIINYCQHNLQTYQFELREAYR